MNAAQCCSIIRLEVQPTRRGGGCLVLAPEDSGLVDRMVDQAAVSAMPKRLTSLDQGSARGVPGGTSWRPRHSAASGATLCVLAWLLLKKQMQGQDSLWRFYAKKGKVRRKGQRIMSTLLSLSCALTVVCRGQPWSWF